MLMQVLNLALGSDIRISNGINNKRNRMYKFRYFNTLFRVLKYIELKYIVILKTRRLDG